MCQHANVKTVESEQVVQGEAGIEFEITSFTYCLDCGAEIEAPTFDVLARDEATVYELEQANVLPY
jgi:hypothetical protein